MDIDLLVSKAKSGDRDSLLELIMQQKNDYYRLAYVYMKNPEDSMDAMQDMIVILYENIYKLKDSSSFYPYSKTILVNCCKKLLRKRKNIVPIECLEDAAFEDNSSKFEDRQLLIKHMEKLSKNHQEVLKLRYFLDMDYSTIAELIKVPLGTVKSRLNTSLRKLKESIEGDNFDRL